MECFKDIKLVIRQLERWGLRSMTYRTALHVGELMKHTRIVIVEPTTI